MMQIIRQSRFTQQVIRQFTPNWFTVTMGTGITALVINQFAAALPFAHEIGKALWLFNILLFTVFTLFYVARWILFAAEAKRIFSHSVMPLFFGAYPMGLATIINGFLVFGQDNLGPKAVSVALVLWWVDAALSVLCGVLIPYCMFTRQDHSIEKMTAVWLLPIVAGEVAAASAAQIIPFISDPHTGLTLLVLSYALWAFSVAPAFGVLAILLLRLVVHKLPPSDMAASFWLTLGPLGTGALGLLLLGADVPRVFAATGMPELAGAAQAIGVIGGTALLGYGVWWLALAVVSTARYLRQGMKFNLGWWGFTFPLGVYTTGIMALSRQTGLHFIADFGAFLAACLVLFWLIVAARTLHGVWHKYLFVAPCLVTGAIPASFEADTV